MDRRTNFAPRMPTILVALALMVVGMLGTFAGILPSVAGIGSEAIGAWSFVAACVVLLLGVVFEGI
jgi:hypothetical protein